MKRKTAGEQMVEGLRQVVECLERGERLEDRFEVRKYLASPLRPQQYTAKDVQSLRKRLGMSQKVFADVLAVSVKTVQGWERQGVRSPMARRLLQTIEPWWDSIKGPIVSKPKRRAAG
jgi:DNA-binding transcriptional regulator YiaG